MADEIQPKSPDEVVDVLKAILAELRQMNARQKSEAAAQARQSAYSPR